MTGLLVQYADVGHVAREWDEQGHDLAAAAAQVADAPVGGLTPAVVGTARWFRSRWAEHLGALAAAADDRADDLRDALRGFLRSDESAAQGALRLHALLEEVR